MAEAEEAYKRWATEEVAMEVHGGVNKNVQMGEEAMQEVGKQGVSTEVPAATGKMPHVEVSQPVQKWSWQMIMESKDEAETPKVIVMLD
ncbi:hypothetical protein M404DRAFT_24525 [Pisolithus tinctorius Marx 270]|uniref:Uncharacterized protein n=1 Tax=Pisolithus tinctorius Marx 270 TaxID=870435 RepID=A0A0C3PDN6_PISTI|nr:hypothetical protein M404DRAFT_24525 [Pisolithus tinctorius Marx 270]